MSAQEQSAKLTKLLVRVYCGTGFAVTILAVVANLFHFSLAHGVLGGVFSLLIAMVLVLCAAVLVRVFLQAFQ